MYQIIKFFVSWSILLWMIISWEKVGGLPIIFLTLSLSFYLRCRQIGGQILVLILSSMMLAVFYHLSFSLSLLLLGIFCLWLQSIRQRKHYIWILIGTATIFSLLIGALVKINWSSGWLYLTLFFSDLLILSKFLSVQKMIKVRYE